MTTRKETGEVSNDFATDSYTKAKSQEIRQRKRGNAASLHTRHTQEKSHSLIHFKTTGQSLLILYKHK